MSGGTYMEIWIEVIGYVGMALILIGFMMKDIRAVRTINMCGAVLSLIYGILTTTIPIACLNAALLIINGIYMITYLIKHKRKKQ